MCIFYQLNISKKKLGTYGESCVYDFPAWRPSEPEQMEVEYSTNQLDVSCDSREDIRQ